MASAKLQQLVLFSSPWKIDIDSPLFACYHKPSKASRKRSKLPQAQTLCYVKSQALYGFEDSFKRLRWIGMLFHGPCSRSTLKHIASSCIRPQSLHGFQVFIKELVCDFKAPLCQRKKQVKKTIRSWNSNLPFERMLCWCLWHPPLMIVICCCGAIALARFDRFHLEWCPRNCGRRSSSLQKAVVWDGLNVYGFAKKSPVGSGCCWMRFLTCLWSYGYVSQKFYDGTSTS